ncbi:Uncharacterised protein [Campylobacter hyointestinalis subsp. hyointestinalis]|uniref:Uncharacterized protein n=1 Tax=Campylobacter hyointestinalis subsp. hyointestinalis TaxID=91352 RepID=A0A0S4SVK5_CAMHY|nr:hypothetical protein [Campylobacter hyointestinalis]CUU90510.1 Uncharacterised protein [Campylobacter hyointestinalis subsp. hyointestinalis]
MAIELYPFYIPQKSSYLLIDKDPSLTFTFDNDVVAFSDGSNFTLTDNNFIDIFFEEFRVNYRFYNPYFSLFDLHFGKVGYTGGVGNSLFNVSYSISSKIINLKNGDGSEEYNLNVSSIQDFLQLENLNKSFLNSSFSSADRYHPLLVHDKSYCFLIKDENLLDSFGSIKDSVFTYSSSTALPGVVGKSLPIIFNGVKTSYYTQKDSPLYEFLTLLSSSGLELTINSDYSISTNKDHIIAVLDIEKKLIKIREYYLKFFVIDYSDFPLFSSIISSKSSELNNSETPSESTPNEVENKPSNNLPISDDDDFSGKFGNLSKDEIVTCSLYPKDEFKVKKVTILQTDFNNYTFVYVLISVKDVNNIVYIPSSLVSKKG